MTDSQYRPPDGYLTLGQAQGRLGISKATINRMVRAGKLAAYDDPRNARVKLVRVADVESLEQPRPRAVAG